MAEDKVVQEGKLYAVIGYLWILCFMPLLFKKENKFAQFHGKQGLVLFIASLALRLVAFIPYIGWFIGYGGLFLCGVIGLIGIIQALSGNYWRIPVVGDIAEKIKI